MLVTVSFDEVHRVGVDGVSDPVHIVRKIPSFASEQVTILAVPEPETYAMMRAGLGLMGFVARREKLDKM